jgi:hypothetical protein
VPPDDYAFLLDAAFRDWARWRSTFRAAPWRKRLNNFELSEVDALAGRMDRALRDFMTVAQQSAEASGVAASAPDTLSGHRAGQSSPAAAPGLPAT